ncbi:hypothetical protein NDK47_03010 [Brevibacillus ruminantium]|uniref:Lipoprotein n=1 Tax=Brevibacillus ruminantium TaxID=2950604 RepID=A0ABY4WH04_9BACL|nr:hypothetical protein [Brevibacillus ruminantium]USG66318.1 hypothetical protein NDK47_03010 [Brevibacillus ruminantium]
MIHSRQIVWLLAAVLLVLPGCGKQTAQVVVSEEAPAPDLAEANPALAEPAISEEPQENPEMQPEQAETKTEAETEAGTPPPSETNDPLEDAQASSEQQDEKQKTPADSAKEPVRAKSAKPTNQQAAGAAPNKPAKPAVAVQSPKKQTDAVAAAASPPPPKATKVNAEGKPIISFNDFFDNGDRSTPSDRFWDLKGTEVEINGFMGEVISLEKHWFLLIPEPGAECPFDNDDGTLWNEIMIVFVKKEDKLRYTQGPIKVKGTLDVGIKVDQSGYRTMFRLQNASFETM